MIRCIKLWTGADRKSHFEEGFIDLKPGARGDAVSVKFPVASASFHETGVDLKLGWHPDPDRQLVITLSGTPEFAISRPKALQSHVHVLGRRSRLSPDAGLHARQLQRLQGQDQSNNRALLVVS
jgi:hypothetical protein